MRLHVFGFSIKITKKNVYFKIGFQVVVEDIDRNRKVSGVKGVWSVPSLRTEFPPLCHYCMEVAQGKPNALKLILPSTHFQSVLKLKKKKGNNVWELGCTLPLTESKRHWFYSRFLLNIVKFARQSLYIPQYSHLLLHYGQKSLCGFSSDPLVIKYIFWCKHNYKMICKRLFKYLHFEFDVTNTFQNTQSGNAWM